MSSKNQPLTQFTFTLPVGFLDETGNIHREGIMRPVTGIDELYRERNVQVIDNPAYGILVMLSRGMIRLGEISPVAPNILEDLFLSDLDYLQRIYNQINPSEAAISLAGELQATP